MQALNFCASCVSVECLVTRSMHAQKTKFPANPWNTLAVSIEFPASASTDSVLIVNRATKLSPALWMLQMPQIPYKFNMLKYIFGLTLLIFEPISMFFIILAWYLFLHTSRKPRSLSSRVYPYGYPRWKLLKRTSWAQKDRPLTPWTLVQWPIRIESVQPRFWWSWRWMR